MATSILPLQVFTLFNIKTQHSNSWVIDTRCVFHICTDLQGRRSQDMEHMKMKLIMWNMWSSPVTEIGIYSLVLISGLSLDLNNCCYSLEMTRNIISFHGLYTQGFKYSFKNENGSINAYYNGIFYFEALPCDGVY